MKTYFTFVFFLLAFLIITILIGMRDRRTARKKLTDELLRKYGHPEKKSYPDGRYEQIPRYMQRHQREYFLDDITWNDLDLDEIFKRMDSTLSSAGEEYLYSLLRTPVLHAEEYSFEHVHYEFWDTHETERLKVQLALKNLGRKNKYSVYDYMDLLDSLEDRSKIHDLISIALIIVSVVLIAFSAPVGVVFLLVSCAYNMITYYRSKAEIDPYLDTFRFILRLLQCAKSLQRIDGPAYSEDFHQMQRAADALQNFSRGSSLLMRGNAGINNSPIVFILDYICIVTHIDLIKFSSMLRQVRGHMDDIDHLITGIGRIDASISIASYRQSFSTITTPHLDAGLHHLAVQNMIHPLITEPVPNDIDVLKPVLMTGSNASGKSTFLKNISLCAVFAQTVRFVPATHYEAPFYRIYTSMALSDNLIGGESYFVVEIRSLQRILTLREQTDAPILCCIDEVLRGTNTIERISASAEILRYMAKSGFTVLAATHDIELTTLLQDVYENYHFSETVEDGDVRFTYKLQDGPSDTRNAIRLLEALGYDKKIVRSSSEMAARFMRTGKWN